jgi:hypothetical protein
LCQIGILIYQSDFINNGMDTIKTDVRLTVAMPPLASLYQESRGIKASIRKQKFFKKKVHRDTSYDETTITTVGIRQCLGLFFAWLVKNLLNEEWFRNYKISPYDLPMRWMGGTALSLTSVLGGDVWLTPSPIRFIPGSDPLPPSDEGAPCHHGMARPQVADGGTASSMEGSCEYIE